MAKKLLDNINSPQDVKKLNMYEQKLLCSQIREFLIDSVSETGGHLASNLGVVELSVALHAVFDVPKDKIIWDVGHQAYVHKILTGRRDKFSTLRKYQGLSGFPKTSESECDCFNTGHSSTSISAALGIARARALNRESKEVIAVLGDGAFTGGMIWEALNDAGRAKTKLTVILNDNEMSISKNVGAVAKYLQNIRVSPSYVKSKMAVEKFLHRIPVVGAPLAKFISLAKKLVRFAVYRSTMFEDMGFYYLGPVDGHDIEKLTEVLKQAKSQKGPVFIHVCTQKGHGYAPAENNPALFHGISPFDKKTGLPKSSSQKDYSAVFGEALLKAAEKNEKVVSIVAAMSLGTGISVFKEKFKERFFDVGIAEQHAVCLAAGMASEGLIPVVPMYSSFAQRAYDQILHDVCLQNFHVVFAIDRAGVVGADGETHQGLYDISYLSHMPNMTILSPASFSELEEMLSIAIESLDGPVAIRYPRGNTEAEDLPELTNLSCRLLRQHSDTMILATGRMVKTALEVENAGVLEVPKIKPLDKGGIMKALDGIKNVITIEDGVLTGGFGEMIGNFLEEENLSVSFKRFAYPDEPIIHGSVSELDKHYGLDSNSVSEYIKTLN